MASRMVTFLAFMLLLIPAAIAKEQMHLPISGASVQQETRVPAHADAAGALGKETGGQASHQGGGSDTDADEVSSQGRVDSGAPGLARVSLPGTP